MLTKETLCSLETETQVLSNNNQPEQTRVTGKPDRLIVGISGASGAILGIRALQLLQPTNIETHLVISKAASLTISSETDFAVDDIKSLADVNYSAADISAAISSGSYKTRGMIIAPCSIKTMGEISSGITSTLMSRAADVVLKERRRLVLMLREAPLHAGHLKHALAVTQMGAVISPPVPAFYTNPKSIDEMVTQMIARSLDLFNIEGIDVKRWGEDIDLTGKIDL